MVKGARTALPRSSNIEQQLTPAAQQGMAEKFLDPPTNSKVQLSEGLAKKVVLYGADLVSKMRTIDWATVAKNRSAWLEEWRSG